MTDVEDMLLTEIREELDHLPPRTNPQRRQSKLVELHMKATEALHAAEKGNDRLLVERATGLKMQAVGLILDFPAPVMGAITNSAAGLRFDDEIVPDCGDPGPDCEEHGRACD